jgi:hypothetical protein
MTGAALVLAAVIAAGSAPALAGSVEWKGSTFETDSGGYVLLGVGNRCKIGGMLNIYNAGFYVQKDKADKSLADYVAKKGKAFSKFMKPGGGPDWEKVRTSAAFNTWIWKYGFPKKLVMKFVYSVKGGQVVDAYKGSLGKTIKDFEDPEYKAALDTFFEGVNHPVDKGQTMTVKSVGDTVTVSGPFPTFTIEKHWRFRQAIWRIWFGPQPIQEPLKEGLTKYAEKLSWPSS